MSRGGDKSTADHGGRVRTGCDFPKSSRLRQVERSSSYSLYLALLTGLKQIGRFFVLRDADHFLDSSLWSLGSSLLLL